MKFKIGDRVKFVKVVLDHEDYDEEDKDILPILGDVGTLEEIWTSKDCLRVTIDRLNNWFYFLEDELEKI